MRTSIGRVFVGTALACGLSSVAWADTIRFAHMNSATHFVNVEGEIMAANIAERANGEIELEVYPSGQLGENSQITEQISLGSFIISQVGAGALADYVPDYSIIVFPFLYPNYEAAQVFLRSDLVKDLERQIESTADIKVLCYVHFGVRDLYTRNHPVYSPDDSAGLIIRVQPVAIFTKMVEDVLQGAPTPMPWPEVYSALAQGVIDGAEAPPASVIDQRHYEHARYLIQTNHTLELAPLITSASLFNGLSEDLRQIVQDEATDACKRMSDASVASYDEGINFLREQGMEIIANVDRAAFASRAGSIAEAFPEWSDGLYTRAQAIVAGE